MFTGIVEIIGTLIEVKPTTEYEGCSFKIGGAGDILSDCHDGDSISVNGCCLTVTEFDSAKGEFSVNLSNETLSRTNLKEAAVGQKVNLERAMSGSTRFGGHLVQGHIDTTATIVKIQPDGDSKRVWFTLPLEFYQTLIPKGFISIDGTSLTLTELSVPKQGEEHYGLGVFGVMLVAYTQPRTVVGSKVVGDTVNIECDAVGKGVVSVVNNVLLNGLGAGGALESVIEAAVERALEKRSK